MADRLRVNKLALKVPAWVALAVARLNEVPGHLLSPPSFAVCAATLAFGDELLDLEQPSHLDLLLLSPGGRDLAAAYLLPRAEAALRQELLQSRCSGWPTPPSERAKARAPPPRATSGSRAM